MELSKAFKSHGELCASHPWEVIIGTLALLTVVVSMSMVTVSQTCHGTTSCSLSQDVKSSDLIILTLTRCIAVAYLYIQFRNLRRLGSKYLLGIAGLFTIFSSFVFSIAVITIVGVNISGLNEALPFFLLLVDLSKACALAKFLVNSNKKEDVVRNIGEGMSILGPSITLDTMVTTLVIGIGTLSGVETLEAMCCFGCLTVMANFLAFMTFYPACLALVFELFSCQGIEGSNFINLENITYLLSETEKQKRKKYRLAQRVKLIMSAGLMIFHTHSRVLAGDEDTNTELSVETDTLKTHIQPDIPVWQFYLDKLFSPGTDYGIATAFGIILLVKYIFFDDSIDREGGDKIKSRDSFEQETYEAADVVKVGRRKSGTSSSLSAIQEETTSTKHDAHPCTTGSFEEQQTSNSSSSDGLESQEKRVLFKIGTDQWESDDVEEYDSSSVTMVSKETQTEEVNRVAVESVDQTARSLEECIATLKSEEGPQQLRDEEIAMLVKCKQIPSYKLESMLGDHERGVAIRRRLIQEDLTDKNSLQYLPYQYYDYKYVEGACCENVIGYMPVPVGVAGPLLLDGHCHHVPMATTEGCLVASTNRGCRAIMVSGGASSVVIGDGMTRAPVVKFESAMRASEVKRWLEQPTNFAVVKETFDSTSNYARLQNLHIVQAAKNLYIRFIAATGDAMGMNMLSKGSEKVLVALQRDHFNDMDILSLSGNFCTDKKSSAVNWLEGRGKSVVCEAVIPSNIVSSVLKTTTLALVELNINKNLIGSAMAGSIGGFNAHAANVVTAIFIATGQDPAQNVASSNCLTVMEAAGQSGEDLYISCTMPSIEVGTVGGGTVLPPQTACLKMLNVKGSVKDSPGENASSLARIVCGTVMAGELSLMSALAAGHLVKSHLKHNRSSLNVFGATNNLEKDSTKITRCSTSSS